jgi:hypothetical protein
LAAHFPAELTRIPAARTILDPAAARHPVAVVKFQQDEELTPRPKAREARNVCHRQ